MQKLSGDLRGAGTLRVGVFDSGIGGLSVLAACVRRLPAVQFLYFGDNGHAPYGSRPPEQVARLCRRALLRFRRMGADAVVLACNTATAVCADEMRGAFSFPVIGMEPAVAPAARVCRRALVLATPLTAHSARLRALIARFPACRFEVAALPRFAAAIEGHFCRGERLTLSDHLPRISCDGVVLGCTHYALLRDEIAAFYGVPVFDGAEGAARRLETLLSGAGEVSGIGTDDHLRPEQNPNKCFTKRYKKAGKTGVIFLGTHHKVNEKVYFSNICFRFR